MKKQQKTQATHAWMKTSKSNTCKGKIKKKQQLRNSPGRWGIFNHKLENDPYTPKVHKSQNMNMKMSFGLDSL